MKITIEMSDDVYNNVRSQLGTRIAMGNAYGDLDNLLIALVRAVDAGQESVTFERRKSK